MAKWFTGMTTVSTEPPPAPLHPGHTHQAVGVALRVIELSGGEHLGAVKVTQDPSESH